MRCRDCGAKWNLVCTVGPGGQASPGQYSVTALGLVIVGCIVAGFVNLILGILLGLLGLFVFGIGLFTCGYQTPSTAYQGSLGLRHSLFNFAAAVLALLCFATLGAIPARSPAATQGAATSNALVPDSNLCTGGGDLRSLSDELFPGPL